MSTSVIVGIDLGTTNSVVAVMEGAAPEPSMHFARDSISPYV